MSPSSPRSAAPSPPPMSPIGNSRTSHPTGNNLAGNVGNRNNGNGNVGRGNNVSRSHGGRSHGSGSEGNRNSVRGSVRGPNKGPSVFDFKYLLIEVKDTGAGISPENIEKLFGQYVQFNAGALQNGGGSGLGLWISKGIIDMHGSCLFTCLLYEYVFCFILSVSICLSLPFIVTCVIFPTKISFLIHLCTVVMCCRRNDWSYQCWYRSRQYLLCNPPHIPTTCRK